jgi:UPF0176 protein
MFLFNRVNKQELKEKLKNDDTLRTTISFYRYVIIQNTQLTRDKLFYDWQQLGVLGRIYIAYEGINAQLSIPTQNVDAFIELLNQDLRLKDMPLKYAVEDDGKSFYKLTIKIRKKIVADGLNDNSYDVTNVGKHLNANEFNQAMEQEGTVVVDMRNQYESEVGHFEGALLPDADTFREELQMTLDLLANKKQNKVLLYCTGGIRCEKASAYLKHHGFEDVNQLYGGIIEYSKQIKEQNLVSKFKGKNFVFDERLGEQITDDILSNCHQCGNPCNTHTNCANVQCHLLFIQCQECSKKMNGCCSNNCVEVISLPEETQIQLRKGTTKDSTKEYKERLRPKPKFLKQ